MRDDKEPEAGLDDSEAAARINFRDYPSSAVVVIAALGSGLAWLIYRWRARKGTVEPAAGNDTAPAKSSALGETSSSKSDR
jgi:hypothetical protein